MKFHLLNGFHGKNRAIAAFCPNFRKDDGRSPPVIHVELVYILKLIYENENCWNFTLRFRVWSGICPWDFCLLILRIWSFDEQHESYSRPSHLYIYLISCYVAFRLEFNVWTWCHVWYCASLIARPVEFTLACLLRIFWVLYARQWYSCENDARFTS